MTTTGDGARFDACVIGAGMAGLSAALMLGRARRTTLVADASPGRNAPARAVHGVLGHDGTPPERLRALARQQVASYPDVTVAASPVTRVAGQADSFEIMLADTRRYRARRVLLATGVADELPPIEGLRPLWGRTVVHCPYCHGWELRDQPLAFLILRPADVFLGFKLTHLSGDVTGLLNGAPAPPAAEQELLRSAGITLRPEPITRLAGHGDQLRQVVFADGTSLARAGLFVHPPARQAAPFAASLGCDMLPDAVVAVDDLGRTSVPRSVRGRGYGSPPFHAAARATGGCRRRSRDDRRARDRPGAAARRHGRAPALARRRAHRSGDRVAAHLLAPLGRARPLILHQI